MNGNSEPYIIRILIIMLFIGFLINLSASRETQVYYSYSYNYKASLKWEFSTGRFTVLTDVNNDSIADVVTIGNEARSIYVLNGTNGEIVINKTLNYAVEGLIPLTSGILGYGDYLVYLEKPNLEVKYSIYIEGSILDAVATERGDSIFAFLINSTKSGEETYNCSLLRIDIKTGIVYTFKSWKRTSGGPEYRLYIANVNDDSEPELIVCNYALRGPLWVLSFDDKLLWTRDIGGKLTFTDANSDGITDIIRVYGLSDYFNNRVTIINGSNGMTLSEWPIGMAGILLGLGDVNNDGMLELIMKEWPSPISAISGEYFEDRIAVHRIWDGTVIWRKKFDGINLIWPEAAIGDINGDGIDDLVAACIGDFGYGNLGFIVLSNDGKLLYKQRIVHSFEAFFVLLGDIDGDRHTEIIIFGERGDILAYDTEPAGTGTPWPYIRGQIEGTYVSNSMHSDFYTNFRSPYR